MSHIFISYSHKDAGYAHTLAESLQNKGFEVWIDVRLDYGSQWPHEIQKYLDTCEAFILIMSANAFTSEWVQSELQRAKRKRKPVFPLLLEGEEPWLSVESTQFYDVRDRKLPVEEFYSDLKQAVTGRQTPPLSQVPASGKKTGRRPIGMLVALGSIALLSICLVAGVLLFQQVAGDRSPSAAPTGVIDNTAQLNTTPVAAYTITASASLPVELPEGPELIMIAPRGERVRYTIVSAWREPFPPDSYLLHLRIQVWTDSAVGINFWNDSFRLVAGDQRLAPVSYVNEIVERDEIVEGDVEFEIDPSLQEAVLEITAGLYFNEPWAMKELRLVFP
jgi:hypothetical protein